MPRFKVWGDRTMKSKIVINIEHNAVGYWYSISKKGTGFETKPEQLALIISRLVSDEIIAKFGESK